MKICITCRLDLPLSAFVKAKTLDGLSGQCRKCRTAHKRRAEAATRRRIRAMREDAKHDRAVGMRYLGRAFDDVFAPKGRPAREPPNIARVDGAVADMLLSVFSQPFEPGWSRERQKK